MTQKRRDGHSTEFGLWTREQPEIDSSLGYIPTNIDWMWRSYKNKLWMLIEEKRYGYFPKFYQTESYAILDAAIHDDNYRGFHLLVFENTDPDDGAIFLDGYSVTQTELIEFMQFSKPSTWYTSYFPPEKVTRQGDFSKLEAHP